MNVFLKLILIPLFSFLLFLPPLNSQVKLPKLVSDGMILQRNEPVTLWGWAAPGEKVQAIFNQQTFETLADAKGSWEVCLPEQKAGGPYTIEFVASNKLKVENVLFGDVWLCSGQSNMEYPFSRLKDKYANEIAQSANSSIRQFKVKSQYRFDGENNDYAAGAWVEANPESLLNFSAVAYFFAKNLYDTCQVPMGIINASLGGSPIDAWMSADALKEFPASLEEATTFADKKYVTKLKANEQQAIGDWYKKLNTSDKGLQESPNWKDPSLDDSAWERMNIPGCWESTNIGKANGAVWFRRKIEVPEAMAGKPARLFMGRIVDADSVFINGICVGATGYQYPQRDYKVPQGVLLSGSNRIVVRVISNSGSGGFVEDKPYKLFAETDTVYLQGEWKMKRGCAMSPTPGQTFVQWKPTGLYNAMIAPSNRYRIKGAVWYQGESNTGNPETYQPLLTAMITDWRVKRNQGDFPFIIAQLPNFMETSVQPVESNWAAFRYAQLQTALAVNNSTISVNIDLGEWNDIHPQNKKDVSRRLSLAAQKLAYGKNSVAHGPLIKLAKLQGSKVELSFTNCGSGLVTNNGKEPYYFALAGADGKYKWAKAVMKGNQVLVWCDEIEHPVKVRYAWADNPQGANLYNKEGLPVSPFQIVVE